jgi:hypothetical protein
MTHRAFARIKLRNPNRERPWELHTTLHPVGGDEAADWAEPDGSQVNTMRSDDQNRPLHASQIWGVVVKPHTQLLEMPPSRRNLAGTAVDARNVS